MKNTLLITAFLFSAFSFAQSKKLDKREQELFNILKKSYYLKNSSNQYKVFVAQKYSCLEKYYGINPINEKEFITDKNIFHKTYPNWNEADDKIYIEFSSVLQENLKNENFNPHTKEHSNFPKCLKKADIKSI